MIPPGRLTRGVLFDHLPQDDRPDVSDAFTMLSAFLTEDEHYRASSQAYGDRGIQD